MRFHIEWWLTRTIAAIVRQMPMSVVRACGRGFGRIVYVVDVFHRRIALANLAQAFPTRSAAERREFDPSGQPVATERPGRASQ